MVRAASETFVCIQRAPYKPDCVDSPFHARFGVPVFTYYKEHPLKAARFAVAMAGVSQRRLESYQQLCTLRLKHIEY